LKPVLIVPAAGAADDWSDDGVAVASSEDGAAVAWSDGAVSVSAPQDTSSMLTTTSMLNTLKLKFLFPDMTFSF
jgi:hypothetical protein